MLCAMFIVTWHAQLAVLCIAHDVHLHHNPFAQWENGFTTCSQRVHNVFTTCPQRWISSADLIISPNLQDGSMAPIAKAQAAYATWL
jgi:hypothetical protein